MSEPAGAANDGTPFLPENWNELSPLLDRLLDSPKEERAALLAALSDGNTAHRLALEQLLVACETETPLLAQPAVQRFSELAKDPADVKPPEMLGDRYQVGRELGRGGMASVYLAHDLKHDRDVAVKIIRSDLSASLGHERFLREIEIAARLRHPNIVPLYDSGQVDGSLFFVMPYEEGQSLRERIRQTGALPVADALNVLRDVARALAYAHEHGVVHRDVKPDNVILSGGAAVVTDFGIAKAVSVALTDARDATLTQAGMVIGTPAYMAPEQATADASIDHRADIYSFGCLGYELFVGVPPFEFPTVHQIIAAHIATVPRPIAELRGDVPPAVAELLARCLAKDPAARVQSARDLLAVLDGDLAGTPPRRIPPAHRMRRPSLAAAGTVLVGLLATAGYVATTRVRAGAPISVAVLPFANIASDSAIDFVSDGLADELASALTRVPGIRIKSRTGARFYRGQLAPDVTEAGTRLKADYLVTAVVRQQKGQWILSVNFERSSDATSLWGEDFHVGPADQAAAATVIAANLTDALRRQFPRAIGVAAPRSSNQRTSSNEAYGLYLRGQEQLNRRAQSVKEAAQLFRRAIHEDTLFAPAYSGLATALALFPNFEGVATAQVYDEVTSAAHRALALDPSQSQAHVALGMVYNLSFDWGHAAKEFETAVRQDGRNVEARVQYARHLRVRGLDAEELSQLQAARNEDPASALVLSWLSYRYYVNGHMDSALVESEHALKNDPANTTSLSFGALIRLANRQPDLARALINRAPPQSMIRGYVLAKSGDPEGARRYLQALETQPIAGASVQTRRAWTFLGLGDTASALTALERATDRKEIWPAMYAASDPIYTSIRESARFRQLLKRVGLSEYVASAAR
jgi:serine/threonine-protein kinase